jgi:hypothetical protein
MANWLAVNVERTGLSECAVKYDKWPTNIDSSSNNHDMIVFWSRPQCIQQQYTADGFCQFYPGPFGCKQFWKDKFVY